MINKIKFNDSFFVQITNQTSQIDKTKKLIVIQFEYVAFDIATLQSFNLLLCLFFANIFILSTLYLNTLFF